MLKALKCEAILFFVAPLEKRFHYSCYKGTNDGIREFWCLPYKFDSYALPNILMALLKYVIYITYVAWSGFKKILLLIKLGRFIAS